MASAASDDSDARRQNVKLLVLGHGSMGRRHARNAFRYGWDVAIYDPIQPPDAPSEGLIHLRTERAARACKPDAIVIATPAFTHAELLAKWNGSVVPILVEKPLAMSVKDYWRPRETASHGAIVVGYSLRFQLQLRRFRTALAALAGPPSSWRATCWISCNGRTWPGKDYADSLLECSHEVDAAQWLFGAPHCLGASISRTGQTWELMLKCGETPTFVHLSTEGETYQRWISVIDQAGCRLWWGWHVPSSTSILMQPGQPETREVLNIEDVYREEMRAFLDGRYEEFCDLPSGMAVLAICDRAREIVGPQSRAAVG